MRRRLALLTYANALLAYGAVSFPETGRLLPTVAKVATSLWWLLPLATPFALAFSLAGAPVIRRVHDRLRPRTRAAGAVAALAFLIPAAALTEAALAARDGPSPARFGVILAGGLSLVAAYGAARSLRRRRATPNL